MRVLHVLASGSYSGAENVCCQIINGTTDKVESLYFSPKGSIGEILSTKNIRYYGADKLSVKTLKKVVKEFNPDVIHAHDFKASLISVLGAKKIPVVSHIHKNDPRMKKIGVLSLLYLLASRKIKKILTVSPSVMQEYVFGKKCKNKTLSIGNPLSIDTILERVDKESVVEKKYDLCYCGRLSPEKNPLGFIEICKSIKEFFPEFKAVMIGDGVQFDEVRTEIENSGLESNVILKGFMANPYPEIDSSKITCVTSLWEGFGLVAIESMSLGVPVVASRVGGLVDIVDDECGKLCDDKEIFIDEIKKLLTEHDYLKLKSENAVEVAKRFDNFEKYTSDMLALYTQLAEKQENK